MMNSNLPVQRNLLEKMHAALTVAQRALLRDICTHAEGNGVGLYIVGGFVRDLILGGAVREVDFVVEGDAIDFTQTVALRLGGRVTPHRRFGTAKWRLPREFASACGWTVLDFVMARSESYARPAALPVVTRAAIGDDMLRRDFTINTLAICLDAEHAGDVLDSCGGAADLELRLLKVLHPRSFEDDPTRMLRAVRFAERLGCELAPGAVRLLEPACAHIAALSGDRVRHELQLVFEEKHPAKVLARLDGFGLLAAIHPALADTADAWLKQPQLGMVPLFQAGDKEFYHFGRALQKELQLGLTVLCSGHQLEHREFMVGFTGINHKPLRENHDFQLHPLTNKIRLAAWYGLQYLKNPAYINESFFDSIRSYVISFLVTADFMYLFHYLAWDEPEINRVLNTEYGWEADQRFGQNQWRMGDGQTAFNNYIYHQIAGFTEFDAFRSNQIREGLLDRDAALRLVENDNQPKFESIEYFARLIGMNLDEVLRKIENIPKLY